MCALCWRSPSNAARDPKSHPLPILESARWPREKRIPTNLTGVVVEKARHTLKGVM